MGREQLNNFYSSLEGLVNNDPLLKDIRYTAPSVDSKKSAQMVRGTTRPGRVFKKVTQFLQDNNFLSADPNISQEAMTSLEGYGKNTFANYNSGNVRLPDASTILEFVKENSDAPSYQIPSIAAAFATTLDNYLSGNYKSKHWSRGDNKTAYDSWASNMPGNVVSHFKFTSNEAFGSHTDEVIPDMRQALTDVLCKSHYGITNRVFHRLPNDSQTISYIINQDEFFKLEAANASTMNARWGFNSRHRLIDLLTNPEPIDMTLKQIVPLMSNDTGGKYLYTDGVLKTNVHDIPLFDLALKPNEFGYEKINHTDIVSEDVRIKKILLEVSYTPDAGPAQKEVYAINTINDTKARLVKTLNNDVSTEAQAVLDWKIRLFNGKKTEDGTPTQIFNSIMQESACIMAAYSFTVTMDRMQSRVGSSMSQKSFAPSYKEDTTDEVKAAVQAIFDKLTLNILGYELDAKYSEENLRKLDKSVRCTVSQKTWELPQGVNIAVDQSLTEAAAADHILQVMQEVKSLGVDIKNLKSIERTLFDVHDKRMEELRNPKYIEENNGVTLSSRYPSGQRIQPFVSLGKLDLSKLNVKNVRSGDLPGDIRQYVNSYLNKLMSTITLNSLYNFQLEKGENPVFKVIAQPIVIENLFSIPHYHPAYMPNGGDEKFFTLKPQGDSDSDFTRVLDSGVILKFVSTNFTYMKDKIIIVPFKENDAESVQNFGHNHDGGQYIANYNLNENGNAAWRRTYGNFREQIIITCPVGAEIQIENFDDFFPDLKNNALPYPEYL